MATVNVIGAGKTQSQSGATLTIVNSPQIHLVSSSLSVSKGYGVLDITAPVPPGAGLTLTFTNLTALVVQGSPPP